MHLFRCRGRNSEGQCGAGESPLVVEPAELDALTGSDISSLAAGSLHSAAVLKDGSVLTWGSGKAGKLGHGVGDDFARPCRYTFQQGVMRAILHGRVHVSNVNMPDFQG